MAKNIAVSDEVYELLTRFKLPGESFSDVIKRVIKRGGKLMDLAGTKTIPKEQWALVSNQYSIVKESEIERKKEQIRKIKNTM